MKNAVVNPRFKPKTFVIKSLLKSIYPMLK